MCARKPMCRAQRGLSIIELMVGIVVALLVGLAAAGSASVFTASQRQGMGMGGSVVNVGTALAALKNDAAAAGLGFFGDSKYLCNRLNLSVDAAMVSNGASFAPVRITTEAGGDRVDVVYASQIMSGTNVLLNAASNAASAELRSLLPATAGQAVLLAPATPGDPCTVRTVTAITPATPTSAQMLTFAAAGHHNQAVFTTPVTYPDKGRVTLLGDLRWSRYRLDGTNLLLERPLEGGSAVLARNVIGFRAEYGISAIAAGSTTLESWQPASGGFAAVDSTTLPRVRALRIGMVTRSPQREKPNKDGVCEASSAKPRLFDVAVEPDVSDWPCYRFRSVEIVVPLRNLVWGVKV